MQTNKNDYIMNRRILLFVSLCISTFALAQAPAGYYSKADGKSGQELRKAMEGIINPHTSISYGSGKKPGNTKNGLWGAYLLTDVWPVGTAKAGKIWDMYSSTSNFTPVTDQDSGSGNSEGYVYNREHSFPKSWFDDATPMYTDLYHVVPTDKFVNGKRGNNPFGEVGSVSWASEEGFSKLGTASAQLKADGYTYSDQVFEPNDMYKGDFARNYFYMLTCYASQVASWPGEPNGQMFQNGDFLPWAIKMLLKWSKNDPVDKKERDRIEAVYSLQKNRNPFIDAPGLEQYIWGDLKTTPINIAVLTGITQAPTEQASNISFDIANGMVNVEINKDNTTLRIYDISGRAVINATLNKGTYAYPLPQGLYIIGGKKVVAN